MSQPDHTYAILTDTTKCTGCAIVLIREKHVEAPREEDARLLGIRLILGSHSEESLRDIKLFCLGCQQRHTHRDAFRQGFRVRLKLLLSCLEQAGHEFFVVGQSFNLAAQRVESER